MSLVNQTDFKKMVFQLKDSGYLYGDIAKVIGCSDRHLRRIMSGKRNAKLDEDIALLSEISGISKESINTQTHHAFMEVTKNLLSNNQS